jgi:hypothetical protein
MRRALMAVCASGVLFGATAGSAGAATLTADAGGSFGNVEVGTTSPPKSFTLALSPGELTFTPQVAATPPFSSSHACGILVLGGNSSCKIEVTLNPPDTGHFTGTLTAGGNSGTIALDGDGVKAGEPAKKCKKAKKKKGKNGAAAAKKKKKKCPKKGKKKK